MNVYPKGLVKHGHKSPLYVNMESIYKNKFSAVISMTGLQGEEGSITLLGSEELYRYTNWGIQCYWCEKKYYFDNMLIIVDKEFKRSVMCPQCYNELTENK